MKKYLLLLVAAVFILFSSCEEENKAPKYNSKFEKNKFRCTAEDLPNGDITSGVAIKRTFWPSKPNQPTFIYVKFLNREGSPFIREKVKHYAKQWEQWANIKFVFVADDQKAQIRITFKPNENPESIEAAWSKIGRTDRDYHYQSESERNAPTMNYCILTDSTDENTFARLILHEFGHALGLTHEQNHPNSVTTGSYKYKYSDPYNFYTDYDKRSIMHYEFYAENTMDGVDIPWNYTLSEGDKAIVGKIYPFTGNRSDITEKKTYTLDDALVFYQDLASRRVIIYLKHPENSVNGRGQINPSKEDQYKVVDGDRKEALFTSKTRFRIRNVTKLQGSILIYKNGDLMERGNGNNGWIE